MPLYLRLTIVPSTIPSAKVSGQANIGLSSQMALVGLKVYRLSIYHQQMIKSFRCDETERLFNGERVRRFRNIESVARRKLPGSGCACQDVG